MMKAAAILELLPLNRLLIQKLGEVARVLDPEVYRELGLGELVGEGE